MSAKEQGRFPLTAESGFSPNFWLKFGPFFAFFLALFFTSFWVPFFGRLGCLFGVPFGSLWAPKLPQVGSKTALGTHLLIKSEFSKKRAPCGPQHDFEVSVGPKTPPSRPKIAPRGLREASEEHLFSRQILISILVPFGLHFGCLLGSLLGPKRLQNRAQNRSKNEEAPRAAQEAPRAPKEAPRDPKMSKFDGKMVPKSEFFGFCDDRCVKN